MSLTALLPIFAILGLSNAISWKTKIPSQFAIFFVSFLILMLQVLAALSETLKWSSSLLLASGGILFTITVFQNIITAKKRPESRDTLIVNTVYFIFMSIAFLLALHTNLVVIDDYSYWGTLSKFVFLFNHLPSAPLPYAIDPSHLSYTPGLAAFQYVFYFANGSYSVPAGYLAQNTLIFACLMPLIRPRQLITSLSQIALSLLILSLASGYVLGRMQADPILLAIVFSIVFLLQSDYEFKKILWIILPAILALYWVKEIGFFLALFCLSAAFFCAKVKLKRAPYLYIFITLAFLFLLKWLWTEHYLQAGFHTFAQNISFSSILSSLNPFNANYQPAQWLMIQSIFLNGFDRILKLPYILFYGLIGMMWRSLNTGSLQRSNVIINCFITFLIIYLFLIYFLEALSFQVGHAFTHLLAFSRYFNILFAPFLLFMTNIWYLNFEGRYLKERPKKYFATASIFLALCPALILFGAMQRFFFSDLKPSNAPLRTVATTIKVAMNQDPKIPLCLSVAKVPLYEVVDPLQFYLLPIPVKPLSTMAAPKSCHFLLMYAEDAKPPGYTLIRKWSINQNQAYLYRNIDKPQRGC